MVALIEIVHMIKKKMLIEVLVFEHPIQELLDTEISSNASSSLPNKLEEEQYPFAHICFLGLNRMSNYTGVSYTFPSQSLRNIIPSSMS